MSISSESRMGLRNFRQESCCSYIVWDRQDRVALVVDPFLELMDHYREFLSEQRLRPVVVVDTHTHTDHFSVSHLFRDESGAEVAMSEGSLSSRPARRLKNGDLLRLGSLEFRVIFTPGHAPDGISLLTDGFLFSGDCLGIGTSGRTDFPGSDPSAHWRSLRETLAALPDSTVIFPSHDSNDILFSTLGVERRGNPVFRAPSFAVFGDGAGGETPLTMPQAVRERLEFNRNARPAPLGTSSDRPGNEMRRVELRDAERVACINVEKYSSKLEARETGILFVDVREPAEFAESHIPGTRNIPLAELALHLSELASARRVYFSCLTGRRSLTAAKTFNYLGLRDVVNVTGGLKAWTLAGLPVRTG